MCQRCGPRDPAENWSCGYEPHGLIGVWVCLKPATWHGFQLNQDGTSIVSMMAACDDHKALMSFSADYVHAMVHPCAIPGSMFRWPENECHIDWDERELTGAVLSEMVA